MRYRVTFKEECFHIVDIEADDQEEAQVFAAEVLDRGGQETVYGDIKLEKIEEVKNEIPA